MEEYEIRLWRRLLSDGSPVYGAEMMGHDIDAISEADAASMAFKICDAIKDHTNEECAVICVY